MADLTVIILTMNEENNIENCINSIKRISNRVVVVDSGSKDKTVEKAKKLGADVYYNNFINYSTQFNWGLDNTGINTKWVLRLDADEVITPELATEMCIAMNKHINDNVNGMVLRLRKFFLGRRLSHGGTYPFKKLMLFKYGIGRIEDRNMDEHTILSSGKTIELRNDALHYDFKDITHYIKKHNWYSTREVKDYIADNVKKSIKSLDSGQIKNRRMQKKTYYKLPKFFRAFALFIYRYIFQFGFLDGKEGFVFHILNTFWYRFLVDVKIYEFEKTKILENETGALE